MTRLRSTLQTYALLGLLVAVTASGCQNCKRKPPAPKLEDTKEITEPVVEETQADITEKRFQAVLDNCELTSSNRIKNCQNDEYNEFIEYVRSQGANIVTPTTEALLSGKVKKQRLAAQILRDFIPSILHTMDPSHLAEGDVRALLGKLQEQNPTTSNIALDTARPILALTSVMGMEEEARNTIKQFDPSINKATMWVHLQAIKGYSLHARLGAFDLIKETFKSDVPEMQVAAVEAIIDIPNWTKEESQRFCEWGGEILVQEGADKLKGIPAQLMLRCDRDPWQKKVMDEAEKREKNLTYGRPFADHFRFICPKVDEYDGRTDEICKRQYALLLRVSQNPKFSVKERKYALAMMADRWPDEETVKALESLSQDSNTEISDLAKTMKSKMATRIKALAEDKARKERGDYTPPPQGPGEGG